MSEDVQGPLAGLKVVDLSTTLPGAFAGQFFADAGAEVIQVEPPGGSPLRELASWPSLGRGKRSVVLNVKDEGDRAALDGLLAGADVVLTTFAPARSEELGLTPERFAALNPRLVSVAITGWGPAGPWRDLKGYEGLVLAKIGYFHVKRATTSRPGPGFVSVPYASWGAAQTAIQGALAALLERETSGRGQHVDADLVHGVAQMDTWQWFVELVGRRWPEAFHPVEAFDEDGRPLGVLIFPLLIAPTRDGHWLQFAQVQPKLYQAFLVELGLAPLLAEPKWKGFPEVGPELLMEFWELMIEAVGQRTLAEWQQVFESNPDIFAELFRAGSTTLDHPQLRHDRRVAEVADDKLGVVRQVSTMVHTAAGPLVRLKPAPQLNEYAAEIRRPAAVPGAAPAVEPGGLPLAGVTILELTTMFAAPYGATVLTDFGARVIKIESHEGDQIRRLTPFPEASAAKVMQGKESIALDITTEAGREIVYDLVKRCDVVLQSFRAGAAQRLGFGEAALKSINPDLVYVNAPGYGTDGPLGNRPAYAPSIGAAAGVALVDVPGAAGAVGDLAEKRSAAVRLLAASSVPNLQSDGISALGVGTAMMLGVVAARRGRRYDGLTTTMLGTTSQVTGEWNIDYAGRPAAPTVDPEGNGFSALYRLYRSADGWVFLAAPTDADWTELVAALSPHLDLSADRRFADAASRRDHDGALVEVLAELFAGRAKAAWESELTAAGVGCVAVNEHPPELTLMNDECFAAGYSSTATSPIFDEHRRLAAAVRFSRSATKTDGGCLAGAHTEALLRELGYDDPRLADLRAHNVIP